MDPTTTTMQKMATELKVDVKVIRMTVHDNLDLKSYTERHEDNTSHKFTRERRLEMYKKVLSRYSRTRKSL